MTMSRGGCKKKSQKKTVAGGKTERWEQLARHRGMTQNIGARLIVFQREHQDAAVGVKLPAGSGFRRGQSIRRGDMRARQHQACRRKRFVDIFALAVYRRINLVGQSIVALVAFE